MTRTTIEQMYERHAGAVAAYVLRRAEAAMADDIVSDVFLVAWRRRSDAAPTDELAWLLGIARKGVANARRSRLRQRALRQRLASEPIRWPPDVPDEADWPVLRALSRLSSHDREAILLVAWDDLTAARAAAVLGIRKRSFDARLYRARQRLAVELSKEDIGPSLAITTVEKRACPWTL